MAAVIVAAGRGSRMAEARDDRAPKQYREIGGRPVLWHTVQAFSRREAISEVRVVIHGDDAHLYETCIGSGVAKVGPAVTGGATRQISVRNGLEALGASPPDVVLIHDAARPFVTSTDITKLIEAVARHGAAIAATPVADTLKRGGSVGGGDGAAITDTVDRTGLWRALTPQAFAYVDIRAAHAAAADRDDLTDDAAVAEAAGLDVRLVATDPDNFKITTPDDLARAEARLSQSSPPDIRVGSGFDVHKFGPGDHVWLCGLKVPHDAALVGHSDADVGLHALTDAILGAIADGDIGAHFPPSDPQWKGAASDQFLAHAVQRVAARGGRLLNVDVTLVCEAPKVGPHRDAMRARIAEIIDLDIGRVAVKATTSEGLGFPGRREGIAAMATATVMLG
ncbi:MAG: bifunctional 2-C-methyl-D-erythritol 4-phosphate cytidylyltransferase/2-C-methyl-D-erythritol 2,4-cyclodiphosphate synthase [Pseudomonadota bacterium]